mmetsp:Transcript_27210/g.59135  ORF Transcript_27210/g.59135 Transcript_27210/m.59135 type:complete len:213 (-) Transcript_27210:103-741(-)
MLSFSKPSKQLVDRSRTILGASYKSGAWTWSFGSFCTGCKWVCQSSRDLATRAFTARSQIYYGRDSMRSCSHDDELRTANMLLSTRKTGPFSGAIHSLCSTSCISVHNDDSDSIGLASAARRRRRRAAPHVEMVPENSVGANRHRQPKLQRRCFVVGPRAIHFDSMQEVKECRGRRQGCEKEGFDRDLLRNTYEHILACLEQTYKHSLAAYP